MIILIFVILNETQNKKITKNKNCMYDFYVAVQF